MHSESAASRPQRLEAQALQVARERFPGRDPVGSLTPTFQVPLQPSRRGVEPSAGRDNGHGQSGFPEVQDDRSRCGVVLELDNCPV
jgi:hypothetical protein